MSPLSELNVIRSFVLDESPWYVRSNLDKSNKIIDYSWEWAKSRPASDFKTDKQRKEAKHSCKKWVKEKYHQNNPKSSLLGGIILNIILNMIINWIVNKILDSLF
jgi:hypothetical protein